MAHKKQQPRLKEPKYTIKLIIRETSPVKPPQIKLIVAYRGQTGDVIIEYLKDYDCPAEAFNPPIFKIDNLKPTIRRCL